MTKTFAGFLTSVLISTGAVAQTCPYTLYTGDVLSNDGALLGTDVSVDFPNGVFNITDEPSNVAEQGTIILNSCNSSTINFHIKDVHPNKNNASCHLNVQPNRVANGNCTTDDGIPHNWSGHLR